MFLALDIGNSRIKGGLFEGPHLVRTFNLESAGAAEPDVLAEGLRSGLAGAVPTRIGLASVVPALTSIIVSAVQQETALVPEVIHAGMPLPFRLMYATPQTLGTDRLAAAAAGWVLYGRMQGAPRSVVAVDAGTAVTYEVIDCDGRYLGGAIGPGPQLIQRSLASGTAQLPAVPLEMPEAAIGRSTSEALQVGIMFGFLDSVSGMLSRIRAVLPDEPLIVATGGWAAMLHHHTSLFQMVEPHLVLHGIRVLAEGDYLAEQRDERG